MNSTCELLASIRPVVGPAMSARPSPRLVAHTCCSCLTQCVRSLPLRVALRVCFVLTVTLLQSAAHAAVREDICLPAGTFPMIGGGATVLSHPTCFSPPATHLYPWETKHRSATRDAKDQFSGTRIVRYNFHDALYQCTKRRMRLPSVDELRALVAYATAADGKQDTYSIVALQNDARYPGGRYGWGGASYYWTNTLAGTGYRKVVDLKEGRVRIDHSSHRAYVSCVR